MAVCCDVPTALHLRRRFSVPRAYAHDGQLTSLTFVGMRPTVIVDQGDHHHDSLRSAALPPTSEGKKEGGGAKSSRFSAAMMTLPTPSSLPAGGVRVALQKVERAEADSRRVPGIAGLYEEFLTRTKTCREQRYHDDGEKLGAFWADRGGKTFTATLEDEEKTSSSREAKRDSSTDNRRRRRHRTHWWNEEEEEEKQKAEEKEEEKKDSNVT